MKIQDIKIVPGRSVEECQKMIEGAPPVSVMLLDYIERMFKAKAINPTSPTMQQELIYQAGIEKVKMHLRSLHEQQSKRSGIPTNGTRGTDA